MRDLIASALSWVLAVIAPQQPGRHSAEYLTAPTGEPPAARLPIWTTPWRGLSSQEARAIFKDDQIQALPPLQRERSYAAAFASLGIDYDFPTMDLASVVTREKVA